MLILDTNVLSAVMKEHPDQRVLAWLERQLRTSVWTTSITVLEVRFGLEAMPAGKRRKSLSEAFGKVVYQQLGGRVAPFDLAAAERAGALMAERRARGRSIELRDTMIAGIVLACNAALATCNTRHFDDLGVSLVDPLSAL